MKRFLIILLVTTLMASYINYFIAQAATSGSIPDWAQPGAMALMRVSSLPIAQNEPGFLNNMDCAVNEFRLVATSTMRSGCFTATALGLLDGDSGIFIFNGTDEGLPLLTYAPNQVVTPWPGAGTLVSLSPLSGGHAYLSLYTSPLSMMRDERDALGRLTAKRLIGPPDLQVKDSSGGRLIINPQTMAFSDGGSWMVAETLSGAFVRVNLATLDIKAFAPAYTPSGYSGSFQSRTAISRDGRYAAIFNKEYSQFKVYDLADCAALQSDLKSQNCRAYDYREFIGSKISGLQSIGHLRFLNQGLVSFEVWAADPAKAGVYVLAPTDKITSLLDYLALGDSYTSGEGAFNYLSGTDSADNKCHLSARSYPLLIANALFSAQGGRSVACSGAVIEDLASSSENYRGQIRNGPSFKRLSPELIDSVLSNFMPGNIAQQQFVGRYQPAIATVSVAGNDVGFGDILEQCLTPQLSNNDCFSTYEDRLEVKNLVDRTVRRWTALYGQLLRQSPATRLYAVGYPDIVSDAGSCAWNVHLSQPERVFARELVAYINDAMRQATVKAGIMYIDVSQALAGHRLCETASHNTAVNGVTAGRDSGIFGIEVFARESYHPNALGHELIKQSILRQTKNLSIGSQSSGGAPKLLEAPKSGRPVLTRIPIPDLTSRIVSKGQAAILKAYGPLNGLRPNTIHQVRLDGPSGPLLGTMSSTPAGDLEASVTIPGSTSPGGHTIDVIGENQTGQPFYLTQPIYVPGVDNDADRDGQSDNTDSCPTFPNSGRDDDQDGTDDACDGFIGNPPQADPPNKNTGPSSQPGRPPALSVSSQLSAATPTAGNLKAKPLSTEKGQDIFVSAYKFGQRQPGITLRGNLTSETQLPKASPVSWTRWLLWGLTAWFLLMLLYFIILRLRYFRPKATYALNY